MNIRLDVALEVSEIALLRSYSTGLLNFEPDLSNNTLSHCGGRIMDSIPNLDDLCIGVFDIRHMYMMHRYFSYSLCMRSTLIKQIAESDEQQGCLYSMFKDIQRDVAELKHEWLLCGVHQSNNEICGLLVAAKGCWFSTEWNTRISTKTHLWNEIIWSTGTDYPWCLNIC